MQQLVNFVYFFGEIYYYIFVNVAESAELR